MGEKRKHTRSICGESTFYALEEGLYEGVIKDIGLKGVYVASSTPPKVGDIITVAVPSSVNKEWTKIKGEVVRKDANGFGVFFRTSLNEDPSERYE